MWAAVGSRSVLGRRAFDSQPVARAKRKKTEVSLKILTEVFHC